MQHLDEGTIHAWLDGQLPRDEAQAVEAHVAECRQCADAVAEARGLIAASSRILMALDTVPRDVVPKPAEPDQPSLTSQSRATPAVPVGTVGKPRRRWFNGMSLAAAATIVVAIGTVTLMQAKRRPALESKQARAVVATTSGPSADSITPASSRAPGPTSAVVPPAPTVAPNASSVPSVTPERRLAAVSRDTAAASQAAKDAGRAGDRQQASNEVANQRLAQATPAAAVAGVATDSLALQRVKVAEPSMADSRKPVDELKKEARSEVAQAPAAASNPIVMRGSNAIRVDSSTNKPQQAAFGGATPAATGAVRGRVTDANNTGISSGMVTVSGTSTGVTTGANGEYTLGGLAPGVVHITVRRVGYAPVTREITIAAGQTSSADIVLQPTATSLSEVAVTSSAPLPAAPKAARDRAAAPPLDAPPGAPVTATQSNAVGCYELGITPNGSVKTGFRAMPRRVALDAEIVPANADGIWYRARDLARTGTLPNGLWRPSGPDAVEIEWTVGSHTTRVHLNGPPGSMMRGTVEDIDRAAATGDGGSVVAIRRACES